MQATTEAHTEPLRASPLLEIPELPLGPDQADDPPSSPPQVKVEVTTKVHIEPLRASPILEIPEPASSSDEASDPPSSPP